MNSTIASSINRGAVINQKVANGSRSSLLLSSIDFSLTETKTNFVTSTIQEHYLIKLSGKEELLNGQNKNWDLNKYPVEISNINISGNEKSSEDTIPVPKVQLYTGKIQVEWHQVYKIGAGLNNLGNTCFMNTVIQCLTYCPPLANYLLHDNDHSAKCTITGFCMMCLLHRHMKRAIGKTGDVIKPVDVYQRLKVIAKHFQFGRQEDAHEFLRYVIDHLWKACLPQTNGISKLDSATKETTVINKIFGGYHRSQVICLKCKKESNTFDHFMDFILDIKQNVMSLEKALEKFTQPELLQHENCYKCPKCKMKVEAKKQFSVYRAPTVATFQLKRFDYNRTFGGKITKQISYPEKLNLRPYMSETKGEPVWYSLNAVLVHSGPSCNSGHYYCYVKNSNGFWYIMDDQRVSQVSLNQVLNQSAYVLFYIRAENAEKTPFKKSLDVKGSFMMISNNHFENSPEMKSSPNSFKSTPLREKSPFANSNQLVTSPSVVKQFNSISAPSREKVSFGFRAGLSPNAFTPKSKNLPSMPVSTPQGVLVPYVKDSDSSDADEEKQSQNKKSSTNVEKYKQSLKNFTLDSYNSSPRLELKTKLSKSVFNNSPSSFSRIIPKVNVSGNWIVTDASETASCSSSTSGANSLSDWNVTAIDDVHKSLTVSKNKEFDTKELPEHANLSFEKSISKLPTSEENGHLPSATTMLTGFESNPATQQCNFRKQQHKFQQHFSQNEETTKKSFKRKHCDSYSKVSKDSSNSELSENRRSPVPKKVKYSEKSPFLTLENGVKTTSGSAKNFDNRDDVSTALLPQQEHYSASSIDSNSRTYGMNGVFTPSKKSLFHKDTFSLSRSSENRKSPQTDILFTKGKYKNAYFEKSSQFDRISTTHFLYGTEVPTWKSENHHRPSLVPTYEHRRSFDDYDEEFDCGKVRKSKMKDKHQFFHRKNPFQKYSERYHKQYNGKFYNNHYHHSKHYDSHYNWKSKQNDNYHRYRSHQRPY